MANRLNTGGNGGAGKGLVDIVPVCEGCTLFTANPQHRPPDGDMPFAIADVLPKWMGQHPIRIRETLPIVSRGNTVAVLVWWDRLGPGSPPEEKPAEE
jgi:hypothetical protein